MKKRLSFVLTMVVLLCLPLGMALADTQEVTTAIFLDGERVPTESPTLVRDGRTLLGIRDYFEALGASVEWSDADRTAEVVIGEQTILMKPDTQEIFLNGKKQVIDVAPQIINARIYVPLRYLSETFGYKVSYYQSPLDDLMDAKGGWDPAFRGAAIIHLSSLDDQDNTLPFDLVGRTYGDFLEDNPYLQIGNVNMFFARGVLLADLAEPYAYFFYGIQDDYLLQDALTECGDQVTMAGLVTTVGYAFPGAYEGMPLGELIGMAGLEETDELFVYSDGGPLPVWIILDHKVYGDETVDTSNLPVSLSDRVRYADADIEIQNLDRVTEWFLAP